MKYLNKIGLNARKAFEELKTIEDKQVYIFENFSYPLDDHQFENHIDQLNFYLLLLDQDFQLFS